MVKTLKHLLVGVDTLEQLRILNLSDKLFPTGRYYGGPLSEGQGNALAKPEDSQPRRMK